MYATQQLEPEVFERLLFEATYPRLSHELRVKGTPYPALDVQGNVIGKESAEC